MLIDNTKTQAYEIPFRFKNEYGKKTIGVYGDSFACLARHAMENNNFSYELSWMYYLGVLSKSSVDSWGVSGGNENDLAYILQKNELNYDYFILIHSSPIRTNAIIKNKAKELYKSLALIEVLTRHKKNVLHVFWDVEHEVYKFSHKKYFMDSIVKNHPNQNEVGVNEQHRDSTVNKNDQLGGYCHLSNRGNLLLAIEINKHLFSNDESI